MTAFEYRLVADCDTAVATGLVEADSLRDATREVVKTVLFDADAVRLEVREIGAVDIGVNDHPHNQPEH